MVQMDPSPRGLIATKLLPPAGPRHLVHRARLDRLLAQGLDHKLTLICAPAGFGKTTLATTWLQAHDRPVGWVSLDGGDNEPSRFWAYVAAALESIDITSLDTDAVERSASQSPESALASLINAINDSPMDAVLVLDDYHQITDHRIHDGVTFLINQLPPRLHVIVLTRSDPPFLVSRWRANGDLVEIRARDLAFNRDETEVFLADTGVTLSDEMQSALFGRLSGWAAAIRLAAAWMAGREDPSHAVAEFAASDSTIAAYLTAEVLDQLPEDTRRFLLFTSILSRLTGPLCDSVMDSTGGAEVLRGLYDHDLFVDALDRDHVWFRYHPLFAELLAHQLRREFPDIVDELHRRASQWCAGNGLTSEAIEHALAARDWPGVKMLLLTEMLSIGTRSQPAVVGDWLTRVPTEERDTPFFLMLTAFVQLHTGELDQGRRLIERAHELIQRSRTAGVDLELPELPAILHLLSAGAARMDCDLAAATREAQAVNAELAVAGASGTPLARMAIAAATNSMLGAAYWHGELVGTVSSGDDLVPELIRMRINRMSLEASALADAGQLRQAEAAVTEVLDLARGTGLTANFQTNPAYLAAGVVALQRAEYERASERLKVVWERGYRQGDKAPATIAGMLIARIAALTGDVGGALTLLDEAKTAWPGWTPPLSIASGLAEEEARLCITVGERSAAKAVLGRLAALPGNSARRDFTVRLTGARLRLSERPADAAVDFAACAELALEHGRLTRGVETLVEAAVAHRLSGDLQAAQGSLGRATSLAEHEAIVAPFLWHAAIVRPLLLSLELSQAEVAMLGFRQRLLDAMGVPGRIIAPIASLGPVDGLSDRELTVLRLLRGTLSNPEIAATLDISPNTLKTHLRHIYGKLGADNRRLALDRARELNLF
jgi:LuxR family maltose regulon positive regulatory protein